MQMAMPADFYAQHSHPPACLCMATVELSGREFLCECPYAGLRDAPNATYQNMEVDVNIAPVLCFNL